jgi:hypothetical protein
VQRTSILFYLLLITSSLILIRCANPVSPSGGPKDITPPKVISSEPPSKSVYFTGKDIRIDFDEFITLKNPVTEIFISPPLKKALDTRLRGKSLIVLFEDSLVSSTTYSVSFGNAITDLAESNILKGYNYVFSTGSYIDSLSLQGTILSAYNHTPQKDIFIGIYFDNNDTISFDSLPMFMPPYYITRSNEKGQFIFNNIQDKNCKIFALNDLNGDLIFNQPTEKIAFLDTLVNPFYEVKLVEDTLVKADTIRKKDSLNINLPDYPNIALFLFEQTDSVQRLNKSAYPAKAKALLTFRFPVEQLKLTPLNFDSVSPWYLPEYSKNRDSVTLWITRPDTDSITLKVESFQQVTDTIELAYANIEKKVKKSDQADKKGLVIQNPPQGFGFNQYKNKFLTIAWSYPLIKAEFEKVLLVEDKDTIKPRIKYADTLRRAISIEYAWKEDKFYKLIFPDSSFAGLHGISHDTIVFGFRTKAEKDLGNLIIAVDLPVFNGNYIFQMLNEKETTIFEQKVFPGQGKLRFDYMLPGKYKIKVIKDRNLNNRWDSGNYHHLIQPEEVIYMTKIVEVRSNWDVEEIWN